MAAPKAIVEHKISDSAKTKQMCPLKLLSFLFIILSPYASIGFEQWLELIDYQVKILILINLLPYSIDPPGFGGGSR
jgi:hypothetical protein